MTQQLFPDMPTPSLDTGILGAQGQAQTGGGTSPSVLVAPDLASGVLTGLSGSLLGLLANYSPGDLGVNDLDNRIQISLPYPDWAWFSWYYQTASDLTAGQTDEPTVMTVPADRRFILEGYSLTRNSGDNTIDYMIINHPYGYWDTLPASAQNQEVLLRTATATSVNIWPDPSNWQTYNLYSPGPKFLEPGTRIGYRSKGAGSSSSSFGVRITGRMTKLVSAQAP